MPCNSGVLLLWLRTMWWFDPYRFPPPLINQVDVQRSYRHNPKMLVSPVWLFACEGIICLLAAFGRDSEILFRIQDRRRFLQLTLFWRDLLLRNLRPLLVVCRCWWIVNALAWWFKLIGRSCIWLVFLQRGGLGFCKAFPGGDLHLWVTQKRLASDCWRILTARRCEFRWCQIKIHRPSSLSPASRMNCCEKSRVAHSIECKSCLCPDTLFLAELEWT
jgi:hypothetical protein